MSRAGKLQAARALAIRGIKRVESAQEEFARDYAAFPSVLRKGLAKFARTHAGLVAMIAYLDREIAARLQNDK